MCRPPQFFLFTYFVLIEDYISYDLLSFLTIGAWHLVLPPLTLILMTIQRTKTLTVSGLMRQVVVLLLPVTVPVLWLAPVRVPA